MHHVTFRLFNIMKNEGYVGFDDFVALKRIFNDYIPKLQGYKSTSGISLTGLKPDFN